MIANHKQHISKRFIFIFMSLLIVLPSITSLSVFAVSNYDPSFFGKNDILFYNPTDVGCASGGGTVTQLSGSDNRQKIWNYLTARGLSPEQAAGVMGNIQSESGSTFSPTIQEFGQVFGKGGYGIVQWTNSSALPGGRRDHVVSVLTNAFPQLMAQYYNVSYSTDPASYSTQAEGYVPKNATTGVLMPVADNDSLLLTELNFLYTESTSRIISTSAVNKTATTAGETEWAALKQQTTIAGASNVWVYSYERPGGNAAVVAATAAARVANGQKIFDLYSAASSSGSACTTTTSSTTIDQAHLYDSSVSIACATGTTSAGIGKGYYRGKEVDINLCSLPNTIDQAHGSQPARVNSRVSGAFLDLTNGLYASSVSTPKHRGGKLVLSDSFRTYADQQGVCRLNPGVPCASAGWSNHQMGLAIDFSLIWGYGKARPVGDPIYDWLAANAGKYGFVQLSTEGWHWQPTGAK